MSDLDYDALRKVTEHALPGPWRARLFDGAGQVVDEENDVIATADYEDARHMATFDPPTVLRLLDLAQRADAAEAALERVRALHPVAEYRPCGRRIAEHSNPPPGPPDPPHGCARPADGHAPEECRDYEGVPLTAFARPQTPIVETKPRVFYDCQTCPREQQDRTSPTPCPTSAALDPKEDQ